MTPPIVIDARNELLFFADARAASGWLEAVDVINGEYGRCWDASGRLLELVVGPNVDRLFAAERVFVREAEDTPTHTEELRRALLAFLANPNQKQEPLIASSEASLQELLVLGVARAGYT